jgi:hypothetical protein
MNNQAEHERKHQEYLENLCSLNNLRQIGERPEGIHIIIKEPTYEKLGWNGLIECPDLFLGYYDRTWSVIEMKHSTDKKKKAMRQIESGIQMLVDVFGVPIRDIRGKFVIYTPDRYMYEVYDCGKKRKK